MYVYFLGKDFDKEGNMRNWWTKSSTDNFDKLTKCFEDFYHNYTVNGTHVGLILLHHF